MLAHAKGEAGESRNLAPSQRARSVLAVFALDGPKLAGVGLGNEVDALVIGRKAELFAQAGWHFIEKPNLAQLCGVFWIEKQIGPHELLKKIALFLFRHAAQLPGEILPRRTSRDRFIQMGIHFSCHSVTYSEPSGCEHPKMGAVLPEDFPISKRFGREGRN